MRLYHKGDRGAPVRDVQDRLVALGFTCDPDELGVFDFGTLAGVREFQTSRGLPSDGIVGPETWRSLVEAGYRLGDRMLYHRIPMMRGDDVAELQARLNSLGFECGKVDGIFGPDSLTGLLDFQRNRDMADDGIAGPRVAEELRLVDLATQKHGRQAVRERQWLDTLPRSVAGQRIFLDPECRQSAEGEATWMAAIEAEVDIQILGGLPSLSRSIDTSPPPRLRSQKANRTNVDLVIGFYVPNAGEDEGVYYFSSEHSRSEAGMVVAQHIADRLDIRPLGRTMPLLKETRAPAAIVALKSTNRRVGRIVANVVASLYERSGEGQSPPNR
ncbi:MAG: peptidoglycan-binding protein [Actinomycetota bacterium]|nr:peptidoglycan-binding protein [Actinomycetota bacterium]